MKDKIKQIMLDKLKEMSEEIFEDEACYVDCCSVMNNIAQMLLQCDENESVKNTLKNYSTVELIKELLNRKCTKAKINLDTQEYDQIIELHLALSLNEANQLILK